MQTTKHKVHMPIESLNEEIIYGHYSTNIPTLISDIEATSTASVEFKRKQLLLTMQCPLICQTYLRSISCLTEL